MTRYLTIRPERRRVTRHRPAVETAVRIVTVIRQERVTFLAAGIAYYAFVSLLPASVLGFVLVTGLFGDAVAEQLLAAVGDLLTPSGQELVREATLAGAAGRSGATAASLLFLIWGMLKVFRGIDAAFAVVYGADDPATLRRQFADAAIVSLAVGSGTLIMFVIGGVVSGLPIPSPLEVTTILFLPIALTVVFLPMYYVFPVSRPSPTEAVPGAAVAAIGWTLLQATFQLYAAGATQFQVYGFVGGVLLLVTWLYLGAILIILGAVVNVVVAGADVPDLEPRP